MHGYSAMISSDERSLADHLVRLRRTFGVIAIRLREAVTQAIGQTVSRVAQQVIRSFLSRSPPGPEPSLDDWDTTHVSESLWEEEVQDRRWWGELTTDPEYDRAAFPSPDNDRTPFPSSEPSLPVNDQQSAWSRVAILVCRLAAWCLQRRCWSYPVVTALSVGLIAGVAAYAGGPVAAARTAMSLATLTDLIDSSAAVALTWSP